MKAWSLVALILTLLAALGLIACIDESLPTGQILAALASITVATIGIFLYFRKTKH